MKLPSGLRSVKVARLGRVKNQDARAPVYGLGSRQSLSQQLRPLAKRLIGLLVILVFIAGVTYFAGVGLAGFLNGESVWSKAQKQAAVDLMEYVSTNDPAMLASFDERYALLENDKRAREDISHHVMPWHDVVAALRKGTDIAEAAPGVWFMLGYGSWAPYVKESLNEWKSTDADVGEMKAIADRLRSPAAIAALTTNERQALHDHLMLLNRRIEPGAKRFSLWMAQGASKLHLGIFLIFVVFTIAATAFWFRAAARILSGIRRTEDRLRLLFDTAVDAIVIVDDATGAILDANQAAASWRGTRVDLLRGMPYSTLFDEMLDQGPSESGHTRYLITANDGRLPVEIQTSTTEVSGETVRLELMRDITERMIIERERRVAATLGHELRPPLHAIMLATQVLLKPGTTADRFEPLRAVYASTQILIRRISDMLNPKNNKGEFVYTAAPFRLGSMLDQVKYAIAPLAEGTRRQSVAFHIEADENLVLLGDMDRLVQALFNLLSNASKFSPEGSVIAVEVWTVSSSEEEVTLDIRVIDNGKGIPEEEKKLLWRAEYQYTKKRDGHYEGSGLGLSVVKGISDQAGGRLEVMDNPKGGTIFQWILSLRRSADPAQADGLADGNSTALSPQITGIRCLVADDSPYNRRMLTLMLQHAGHHVVEVQDGAAALMRILTSPLDIALLDMNMPAMTGEQVIEALRAIGDDPSLPAIIAVSADSSAARIAAVLSKGAAEYLPKPVVDADRMLGILSSTAQKRAAGTMSYKTLGESMESRRKVLDYLIASDNHDGLAAFRHEFEQALERSAQAIAIASQEPDFPMLRSHLHALKMCFMLIDYKRGALWCENMAQHVDTDAAKFNSLLSTLRSETAAGRHKLTMLFRDGTPNAVHGSTPSSPNLPQSARSA